MAFEFVSSDDRRLLGDVPLSGLTWSNAAGVGFFRYVPTEAGMNEFVMNVHLPAGVRCVSLALVKWRNSDRAVTLHRGAVVSAYASSPPRPHSNSHLLPAAPAGA